MKVCFVVEGSYPYVMGGVSSWVHSMIRMFPKVEFAIAAVIPDRSYRGKFVYELPENVSEVYEIYLNDKDWGSAGKKRSLSDRDYAPLRSLVMDQQADWDGVFRFFEKGKRSLNDLLMGEDFLSIVTALYDRDYPEISFTDFLWTMRSVYLPLFHALGAEIPKADIYHCVATGYAGIVGCLARYRFGGRLILSEHGIYTREREEELMAFYEDPQAHPEIPAKYGAEYVYVSSYERSSYDVDLEGLEQIGLKVFENGVAKRSSTSSYK